MINKEFFGETKNVEFKREIPSNHEKFLKDIIAFSNSTGGKVILGIEDETCCAYGIGEQSPFKLSDSISNMISDTWWWIFGYNIQKTNQSNQTNQLDESIQIDVERSQDTNVSGLENRIIELLKMWPDATTKEITKKLMITDNQVKYYVKKLKDDGKIMRVGTNRKGSWKVMWFEKFLEMLTECWREFVIDAIRERTDNNYFYDFVDTDLL